MIYFVVFIIILFVIFIFMIKPRKNFSKMQDFKSYLYAHRGLHDNKGDFPENSLGSFALAVKKGYGMEFDLQLSKDGKIVVFHDSSLKRMSGLDLKVADLTYDELKEIKLLNSQEIIPLFDDLLKLVDGKTPLIVELKAEDKNIDSLCRKVSEKLDSYKGLYCVESFNPFVVAWFKKNRPNYIRGQLSSKDLAGDILPINKGLLANLMLNFISRPDFIAYDHNYRDALVFNLINKLWNPPTVSYTVKNQDDFNKNKKYFDLQIFEGFEPK